MGSELQRKERFWDKGAFNAVRNREDEEVISKISKAGQNRRLRTRSGARERPARGGSRLAIGGGSRLAISRSGARERPARVGSRLAISRSGARERSARGGSRLVIGGGSRLAISRSAMVRSPNQVREQDWLEVGGFVRGEAGLGWLGGSGQRRKESRQ
uniref:Uncharacterized protein n=1 Tax=Fagus sylvatica TaxID=28930 RepID=A0A2N9F5U6_FAGSY